MLNRTQMYKKKSVLINTDFTIKTKKKITSLRNK
jgi:hypothetical protein